MQAEDREQILWQLTEAYTSSADGEAVSDEVLTAFRRGEFEGEEAARVVRQLIRHPANRRRLLELAELSPKAAPDQILERLLARHDRTSHRFHRSLRAAALVAAALGAIVIGWWLLSSQPTPPTSPPPAYSVGLTALAVQRDGAVIDQTADAFAETPVAVVATVEGRAQSGVAVGLFRHTGDHLEQVKVADGLTRSERRGVVTFEVPAHALVGRQPGEHSFFVVVARQDDGGLPGSVALPTGSDPIAALEADGRRHAYRLSLRLLRPATVAPANSGVPGPT